MSDVTQDGKIAAQKGNRTSVLDELRAALETAAAEAYDPKHKLATRYCIGLLDKFAAAHPGLVDLSLCGPQCPAWTQVVFDHDEGFDECESMHCDAPTGSHCPVLEARKETT